jgi:hypothetical protein
LITGLAITLDAGRSNGIPSSIWTSKILTGLPVFLDWNAIVKMFFTCTTVDYHLEYQPLLDDGLGLDFLSIKSGFCGIFGLKHDRTCNKL